MKKSCFLILALVLLASAGLWAGGVGVTIRALDLFCGAGGASVGLHRAGFDVTGVDIEPQPHYPFRFVQADAITVFVENFDFVWASPPCQAHSTLRHLHPGIEYTDWIGRTREMLKAWGGPYIIENVPGAPLLEPVRLCGSAFGLGVRRHRLFESNLPLAGVSCCHELQPRPIDVSGTGARRRGPRTDGKGGNSRKPRNIDEARRVMGIDWMDRAEIAQAVPPAYAEFLGRQVIMSLEA